MKTKFHHRDTENTEVRRERLSEFLMVRIRRTIKNRSFFLESNLRALCVFVVNIPVCVVQSSARSPAGHHSYEFRVESAEYFDQTANC